MTPLEVGLDEFPRRIHEIRDTWIPMPDGTRLAVRIWLPDDAADNPVPGIVEMVPYRKNDRTALRDARTAPWFAGHGYAVVRVDVRGTGNSEGTITDEYTQRELDDGHACISWVAQQHWCTGKVGIMGISWGGFNALQIAALQPPDLHAVLSICSTDDRYADDVHYWGGVLLADQQLPWATTMLANNAMPPEPDVSGSDWLAAWLHRLDSTPPFIDAWMRHLHRDEFWRHGSICENPSAIQCPVFLVSGWADAYRDAVFRMLQSLGVPRLGLIGPWAHAWPHVAEPGPQIGFLAEALRWWDRWLKDQANGIEEEPMLRTWMQEAAPSRGHYAERSGRWVADKVWPSPNVEQRSLNFARDTVTFDSPSGEPVDFEIVPVQSHGAFGGRSVSYGRAGELAVDQRADDALATCLQSDPLPERLEILGIPEAVLEISADRPQAMVSVRVCDIAPDGEATLITQGVLNLTHRDSHEHPAPLQPGRHYHVRFPLHAIGYAVPQGHRLGISLSPTHWPLVWPSPEPARLHVHAANSSIQLPVRVRGEDARGQFPPPEYARAFTHQLVDEPEHATVSFDLASGNVTTIYAYESGYEREELGEQMRYHCSERDTFEILQDDPTSAVVASSRSYRLSRGDWDTQVMADAVMSCDTNDFYIRTSLIAYQDDQPIFEREWEFRVPRNLT